MLKTQIQEMIALLAAEFKIGEPRLVFTKSTNGSYFPGAHRIKIGLKSWRGIENLVLHEFAHALSNTRYGIIKISKYRTEWHGSRFAQCLIEIVDAWYGDQSKYSWNTEYKSLRAYGPRKEKETKS